LSALDKWVRMLSSPKRHGYDNRQKICEICALALLIVVGNAATRAARG
jgi:hypothetical protein